MFNLIYISLFVLNVFLALNNKGWLKKVNICVAALMLIAAVLNHAHADPSIPSLRQETVMVSVSDGEGAGVIVGTNYVLTANHVVDHNKTASVQFWGQSFTQTGKVVYQDKDKDWALIQLPVKGPPAIFECTKPMIGEVIHMIGNPLGFNWLYSHGYISSDVPLDGNILIDIRINHGNSGGPIFNNAGKLIGIADASISPQVEKGHISGEPLGVMVPLYSICEKMKEIINAN